VYTALRVLSIPLHRKLSALDTQDGSQNMDDSGFFSSQVLGSALQVWGLELTNRDNEAVVEAMRDPV